MFDKIYIKIPLPTSPYHNLIDIDWKEEQFQTKDLNCVLDNYQIQEDRRLYKEYIKATSNDVVYDKNKRPILTREWKSVDYTGPLNVISIIDGKDAEYCFRYKLDLFNGYVQKIESIKYNKLKEKIKLDSKKSLMYSVTLYIKNLWKNIRNVK